jgi:hypothetical protein
MRDGAKPSLNEMTVSGQTRLSVIDVIHQIARSYSKRDSAVLMDLIG